MAISPRQRVIIFISGAAFLSSMVFIGLSMMDNRPTPQTAQTQSNQGQAPQGQAPQGQNAEALETQEQGYETVLEREPNNLNALEGLINVRLQMGDYQDAIAPLEKMSELEPENPQVWQALAAIHIQSQEFENAIAPMEKLIELQPENEELKAQLAQLKEAAENPESLQETSPSPESSPQNGTE
ncbi:MAG: tetratricopeptide repeat protein [Kamptonema sp. SIO4C4]|nr:tetratricopeptide repeat protein [Kamptonema sp. SIO4C4]